MVIISLTSTSNRLAILRYTLLSLLEQNLKADRIVVNLSKEAYLLDDGVKKLPDSYLSLLELGIEINWVENTGPYRKLIPVLTEANDDDLIVTCDDDVIYGQEWLEILIKTSKENPNTIVCGRARRPMKNFLNIEKSYNFWPLVEDSSLGLELVPIGVAGIVYKKELLDMNFLTNSEFKNIAPKQDDLWFKASSYKCKSPVLVAPLANSQVYEIETKVTLYSSNTGMDRNKYSNFISKLIQKISDRVLGYLGFSVNPNDSTWKKINRLYLK